MTTSSLHVCFTIRLIKISQIFINFIALNFMIICTTIVYFPVHNIIIAAAQTILQNGDALMQVGRRVTDNKK